MKFYPPPYDIATCCIVGGINQNTYKIVNYLFEHERDLLPKFIIDEKLSQTPFKEDFGYIREHNNNYVYMSEGQRLEIISTEDAKFLYIEERIVNFILINPTDDDINKFQNEFQVPMKKLVIVKMN